MKCLYLSLLLYCTSFSLWGQSSTPTTSNKTQTTGTTSGTYYGAFLSGYTSTQPKPTGGTIVATEVSSSQGVWSFSETDFLLINKTIQTSARTGLAIHMRDFDNIALFALADGGVATNGVTTGSAFAGGGFLTGAIDKNGMWRWEAGYRILASRTGGTEHIFEFGFLRKAK